MTCESSVGRAELVCGQNNSNVDLDLWYTGLPHIKIHGGGEKKKQKQSSIISAKQHHIPAQKIRKVVMGQSQIISKRAGLFRDTTSLRSGVCQRSLLCALLWRGRWIYWAKVN